MIKILKNLIKSMKESTKFESEIQSAIVELEFAKERIKLLQLEREIKLELAFAQDAQNRYDTL